MGTFLGRLIGSNGIKRLIASILAVLYGLVSVVPALQPVVTILEQLAAAVGGVGVVQAVSVGTMNKAKLAGVSSILSVLLFLCQIIPALKPYEEIIKQLAELFGAAGVGVSIAIATPKVKCND